MTLPAAEDEPLLDDAPAVEAGGADADLIPGGETGGPPAVAEEEETAQRFTSPSLRDVGAMLKNRQPGLEDAGYTQFAKEMGFDSQDNIQRLFGRFRALDTKVFEKGKSASAGIVESKYTAPDKVVGTHFDIFFPKAITGQKGSDSKTKYPDPHGILSAAEGAYERAVGLVMMTPFINWAKPVKGRIYLITSDTQWKAVRKGVAAPQPVQAVIADDEYREFYVLATPYTTPFLDQAVGYAVAEAVFKEYAKAIASERESQLPIVVLTGLGVTASELESVITEDGPQQVKRFDNRQIGPAEIMALRLRAAGGGNIPTQLPLESKRLIDTRDLVNASSYPKDDERVYYYLRQSKTLTDYLNGNGALAFLLMTKGLAEGESFEKAFDDYYVELRDMLMGKVDSSGKKKNPPKKLTGADRKRQQEAQEDRETAEDILTGFKELRSGAGEAVFHELTAEYMREQLEETKRGQTRRAPR
jgi:hypothetical protein